MPGYSRLNEVQNLCGMQAGKFVEGMHSIRKELDIERIYYLLQDSECPAYRWFPNNAEMKKLAEYLVSRGLFFKEE